MVVNQFTPLLSSDVYHYSRKAHTKLHLLLSTVNLKVFMETDDFRVTSLPGVVSVRNNFVNLLLQPISH